MNMTHGDRDMMSRALQLAEAGMYTATPNPRVGCVIVNALGNIVGEGYHLRAGSPHAEVNALAMAGIKARGGVAYVTLEPCNHQGRTGPCTEALIEAGIKEVIYGMQDPNPAVAGSGLARLRQAGLLVRGPMLEAEALALNPGFIKRMQTGRPYVVCKLAMSLDGRTAMASGESHWITGGIAREDVQKLRARSCSIITGTGTVLADNPQLNVRSPSFGSSPRQPLRVVIDSKLRTPIGARIYTDGEPTVIASSLPKKQYGNTPIWSLPNNPHGANTPNAGVDLLALINKLGAMQHNEVLIEAGPTLAGAFLQAGLIDEIVVYMAGKLMGSAGKPLFELPIDQMSDNIELLLKNMQPVGDDWRITALPRNTLDPIPLGLHRDN